MPKLIIESLDGSREVIELKPGLNRLGRSSANDFLIQDASVSRFHCEIEVREDGMFVRDLDSSNGTFIDDEPVSHARLTSGQTLRLGQVRMLVQDAPGMAEGEVPACYIHPTFPASMQCMQCHKVFCGSCVHIMARAGGKILRLCPICSGHCEPIKALEAAGQTFLGGLFRKLLRRRPQQDKPFYD